MEHRYIDINLVRKFEKRKKSRYEVMEDIQDRYKIKNILVDDETIYAYCDIFKDDYNKHMANYEAYIEEGMDARLLVELRNSALLCLRGMDDFYTGHKNCNTAQEVREYRRQYLKVFNPDYNDDNWQLHFLMTLCWKKLSKDLWIDFESYYADRDISKQTYIDDYTCDFIAAHLRPEAAIRLRNEHYGYDIDLGGQW